MLEFEGTTQAISLNPLQNMHLLSNVICKWLSKCDWRATHSSPCQLLRSYFLMTTPEWILISYFSSE